MSSAETQPPAAKKEGERIYSGSSSPKILRRRDRRTYSLRRNNFAFHSNFTVTRFLCQVRTVSRSATHRLQLFLFLTLSVCVLFFVSQLTFFACNEGKVVFDGNIGVDNVGTEAWIQIIGPEVFLNAIVTH